MKDILPTQKTNEAGTQIFALVAALILAAVLASGCSTPTIQGQLNRNEAPAVSYTNCVQTMTASGLQNQCYNVGSTSTASYNQYTATRSGYSKGVSEEALQASYEAYLSSLDEASLNELNAQWDAIAANQPK